MAYISFYFHLLGDFYVKFQMSESVKELVDANFLELEDSNSNLIASVACTEEGLWIQLSLQMSFHLTPDAFDDYNCRSHYVENRPIGILYKK